jgi:hypothetical protein
LPPPVKRAAVVMSVRDAPQGSAAPSDFLKSLKKNQGIPLLVEMPSSAMRHDRVSSTEFDSNRA